ncbi:10204_t:CDS:2 [Ambispora gerdemannii]|uniref:Patatin-like phospholipase domain-containing protein n=1 Tax=Ambispora gerdemannii TaxID=144530 RepID=A0A9N9AMH0_9GLOM|nr:10204_t:CDS:2 [Ambispora gerdemannii]
MSSFHKKHPSVRGRSHLKKQAEVLPNEFATYHFNKDDIESFARALAEDPNYDSTEHISAVTDFMPIKQVIKKDTENIPRGFDGFTYHVLRFPLMLAILIVVGIEVLLYILVRQIVNIWEYFVQWRGERFRLREQLRCATTYEEWINAAKKLDSHLGFDEWKDEVPFGFYDFNLLRKVNRDLKAFREGSIQNPQFLKGILQNCVKSNFGGVENGRLYSHTYYGTKKIVERYIDEVTESLDSVRKSKALSIEEKQQLFKNAYKNYGRTALCLSGGAGFGYYHLGIVKALFDADLLPSVITGTSAGGYIAALVCVRTDEELAQVLHPDIHCHMTACSDSMFVWFKRFLETGARFDACDWARKVQWTTKGSLTFREAYERTGRILNISVIPYDPHSPPKLLNYITAPDCVIWSAVIASAAVPGILNPVVLMQKTKNGTLIPYNYGHKWKDGSLRTDIPIQALHTHFNVKFTIVSQVNPHIHVFFYSPRGTVGRPVSHRHGRGWRGGFVAASIEKYLKLDLSKWLKVIRDLELLPKVADQDWSSIWLQKFDGNVTIWPKSTLSDWFYLLSDPDAERLERMITTGLRVTWPKLHMISNRLRIERAIIRGKEQVKRKAHKRLKRAEIENDVYLNAESGASTTAVSSSGHDEEEESSIANSNSYDLEYNTSEIDPLSRGFSLNPSVSSSEETESLQAASLNVNTI